MFSKGWWLPVLALATAGMLATTAHAQTGEDILRFTARFPGVGPVMTGMGGAGVAGVDDFSALFLNPAGLAYFRTSAVSGSLASLSTEEEGVFRVPGTRNALSNDISDTQMGHLAYVYRFPTRRGSLAFGVALGQVNTFERDLLFEGRNPSNSITDFFMPLPGEFTLEEDEQGLFPVFTRDLSFIAFETFAIDLDPDLVQAGDPVPFVPAVTRGTVAQVGSVTETGSMRELNFGGAFEAARDVMVGLSVNIPFGTYHFLRVFEEEDIDNANDGTGGTTDFDFLRFEERFRSELVGVNVRAGVTARLAPQVRVGFTVETPTRYDVDEEFDTLLETFFDNGDVFVYGDEAREDAGSGVFEYDIVTPWRLGAGLTVENAGFTLSADAEFVDWSQMELEADGFSFADENRRIRRAYDAVVNARLGVAYTLGAFVLRGGFAYQPDPRTADDEVDRDRLFYAAGFGYRVNEQFQLDFGWMQERFDDQYRPYVEVTDAPVVDEQVVRNRFVLGVKVSF
ncbi:outer membrane protein transport protein [Rhodocaloribacter litoris]|uniref:OmpP1/FadL family transporter n=1 Tax=Rhodocaloribacter litoris TaxID=2558931 RepID=UPI0014249A34|nr:outer membrane protein transport protein [Rhodocaloribacter litoris]QXD14630.1 outer membrane protein transport protein [Rhodocaloribacter litoris]